MITKINLKKLLNKCACGTKCFNSRFSSQFPFTPPMLCAGYSVTLKKKKIVQNHKTLQIYYVKIRGFPPPIFPFSCKIGARRSMTVHASMHKIKGGNETTHHVLSWDIRVINFEGGLVPAIAKTNFVWWILVIIGGKNENSIYFLYFYALFAFLDWLESLVVV